MLDKGKAKGHPHVPYLRNVNVQWGRIDTHDLLTMELAEKDHDRFAVREGDLLVCEGGEIGRCAIWQGRAQYLAFQKALHRVRPGPALNVRFLRYVLEHQARGGELVKLATGSTIEHLPQQQLRRVLVPLPPLDIQGRIADLLESHLSRLDVADDYLMVTRKRLQSLRASSLNDAYASAGEPVLLGDLAVESGYGTSEKCVAGGPGPAVVRIPNLRDGSVDLADEKRVADVSADVSRSMLKPGDVLIIRTNGSTNLIGRASTVQPGVDAAFASYLIRYRVDAERVTPAWVQAMLSAPQSRALLERLAASSAGQHNLSLGKLDSVPIPLPPTDEQWGRLRRLDGAVEEETRLAESLRLAVARSRSLRRALLTAAFSGQLTEGHVGPSPVREMCV